MSYCRTSCILTITLLLVALSAGFGVAVAPAEARSEDQAVRLDGWVASAYRSDERPSGRRDQQRSAQRLDRSAQHHRRRQSGAHRQRARLRLFRNPDSRSAAWVDAHPHDPRAARISSRIASIPTGIWLVGSGADRRAARAIRKAARRRQVPVLVLYNVPLRDCQGQSSGGAATPHEYRQWVDGIAAALTGRRAIIVVEPDALAGLDCLSTGQASRRLSLLRGAVDRLRLRSPRSLIYLDAGHARWQRANVMSNRLARAGVESARGFVLNVANFRTTTESSRYGAEIAERLLPKVGRRLPFVVDTSRNGASPPPHGTWCNPPGVRTGAAPAVRTLGVGMEMTLWVKPPGESDGACGSAVSTSAGTFAPDLAVQLLADT